MHYPSKITPGQNHGEELVFEALKQLPENDFTIFYNQKTGFLTFVIYGTLYHQTTSFNPTMQTAIDTTTMMEELNTPYEVPQEAIAFYRENGYVKLKNVLSSEMADDH